MLEEALKEIDKLAEAGLCQLSVAGKHEFLEDIRSIVAACGLQGGLTKNTSRRRAARDFERKIKDATN